MAWSARLRRVHRLATLVVGAQLLVWTLTGFAFTWFDFANVRGTHDRADAPTLRRDEVRVDANAAIAAVASGKRTVRALALEMRDAHPVYVVEFVDGSFAVVDARDGRVLPPVTVAEAAAIAEHAFARPVHAREVALMHQVDDFDGDVIVVRLDDARATDVFVAPSTGRILAWRNRSWRTFDRLWSLHVLGYVSRDNPAHTPLRILGLLALVAALSGAALWATRLRFRR